MQPKFDFEGFPGRPPPPTPPDQIKTTDQSHTQMQMSISLTDTSSLRAELPGMWFTVLLSFEHHSLGHGRTELSSALPSSWDTFSARPLARHRNVTIQVFQPQY